MPVAKIEKKRLEELLDLAQTYRGCNRKQLAKALGRDPSNLVPESGVPKVDLVVELSRVLDWNLDDVVRALWNDKVHSMTECGMNGDLSVDELDALAVAAHREGRYTDMVELARKAYSLSDTAEARARACNREAGGWDGMGRFRNALEALQRGLREPEATLDRQLLLRANLANAYYALWQLFEGKGVASDVIGWFEENEPETHTARVARATAYYVRGNCYRRMIESDQPMAASYARKAKADLETAHAHFLELAELRDNDSYAGIARTCRGGVIEAEAFLGERSPESALTQFSESLDELVDPDNYPKGDWLESFGWWCIFGCNVAMRHVSDERELQQTMAVFTNKADEIAEHLGNWSMRERVFTLEFARRRRFEDWTGLASDWTIDNEDVRMIAGTMGRFPEFHDTGWRILRTAKFIREN